MDDESRYAQGIAVRREVLGDGYVDRALGTGHGFAAEFQDLRPGDADDGLSCSSAAMARSSRCFSALNSRIAL